LQFIDYEYKTMAAGRCANIAGDILLSNIRIRPPEWCQYKLLLHWHVTT